MKDNPIKKEKLRKLKELVNKGIDPYPHTWNKPAWKNKTPIKIKELLDKNKEKLDPDNFFCVAGRLMRKRPMGKADFFNLEDEQASLQCYIRRDDFSNPTLDSQSDNSSANSNHPNRLKQDNKPDSEKSALDTKVNRENSSLSPWELWKLCDIGDILSLKGKLFITKRGELSLRVYDLKLLCKSIEALPEKYHGIEDKELKYRYRYMDLIMDQKSRDVFRLRSQVIREIRNFMNDNDFMEVETPILQSVYGGAVAEPFETHFRRLNKKMYLKISPEIYLKKLIVGGFEKVYEIGKNFRNEGIDRTHNPEFTMMEYYQAYTDYKDQMELFKKLVNQVVENIKGALKFEYQGRELNFEKWETLSVKEAVKKYSSLENNSGQENLEPALKSLQESPTNQKSSEESSKQELAQENQKHSARKKTDSENWKESSKQKLEQKNIKFLDPDKTSFSNFFKFIKRLEPKGDYQKFEEVLNQKTLPSQEDQEDLKGELTVLAFEILVERHLWNPTFIIDFPLSVSPLTKKHRKSATSSNSNKHRLVERFEPYIAGMELGNAYTELNDPIDQRNRLEEQERWSQKEETKNFQAESGDKKITESSHPVDENFIHALELGMPPTGGVGLGIERLVMILTDQKSIRDCILFPALKDKPHAKSV